MPHKRSSSPELYKAARTQDLTGGEFSIVDDSQDLDELRHTLSRPSTSGPNPKVGYLSDERMKLRSLRTQSPPPPEEAVRAILQTPPARHRSPTSMNLLAPLNVSRPSSRQFFPDFEQKMELDRVPNARLGEEVPIADKTNVLGSTQLSGCPGDFCNLNIYSMTSMGGMSTASKRTKDAQKPDYRKSMFEAGLVDSALENPQRATGPLTHKITFKSIIQARQEMPLVRMQLERHMRGEEGVYVKNDEYHDMTVGGKVPAHFYQETACCQNCFQVYSIVDKARNKALAQLVKKRKKPASASASVSAEHSLQESSMNEKFSVASLSQEDAREYLDTGMTKHQSELLQGINDNKRRKREKLNFDESSVPVKREPDMDQGHMREALMAIEGLTKMDVAEIRTMVKPPAAVEVVMEAVVILLTGRYMNYKEAHKMLSGGEAFLNLLREFNLADVTDERLRMMEVYVDNPLFRPENVLATSRCASKFCAWVHGVVHAARYQRGLGHKRIDTVKSKVFTPLDASALSNVVSKSYLRPLNKPMAIAAPNRTNFGPSSGIAPTVQSHEEELSFVQKLEKIKSSKLKEKGLGDSRGKSSQGLKHSLKRSESMTNKKSGMMVSGSELENSQILDGSSGAMLRSSMSKFDPTGPKPSLPEITLSASMDFGSSQELDGTGNGKRKFTKRETKAMKAMQKKTTDRLSAQTAMEGSVGVMGTPKQFVCSDGISRMPYVVMGKFSLTVEKCNFIIIHDFFDTYDATAILFKPIVQRHEEGCQVLCFNYPGQAHTTWPRPTAAERQHGARDALLNNDFLADRIHELLQHAEAEGDILLSKPFHLVGMGNGACIAAAFCQRYGQHKMYQESLRSVVSINGFLYPDAQLSAILHAAYQVFESTPHNRPDIAVSYWSRFVFSEEYLARVNPNLALNIYTAVSNPITNDGRVKLTRGCLAHRDLRGALSPDPAMRGSQSQHQQQQQLLDRFHAMQVPVVVLQSTEDMLVNAANVDSFLIGRTSKHLWSHMLNVPSDQLMAKAFDVNAQWVGRMATSPEEYAQYSTLGKSGIRMLLDSLRQAKGAFVMWVRSGHQVQQEYKAAVLDLIDVLACPTDAYTGLDQETDGDQRVGSAGSVMLEPSFGVIAADTDEVDPRKTLSSATQSKKKDMVLRLRGNSATAVATEEEAAAPMAATNPEPPVEALAEVNEADVATLPHDFDVEINNMIQAAVVTKPSTAALYPSTAGLDDPEEEEEDRGNEESKDVLSPQKTTVSHNSSKTNSPEKNQDLHHEPIPVAQSTRIIALDEDIAALEKDCQSLEFRAQRLRRQLPETTGSEHEQKARELKQVTKELQQKRQQIDNKRQEQQSIDPLKVYWDHPEIIAYQPPPVAPSTAQPESSTAVVIANHDQRGRHQWIGTVPDAATALALEAELQAKQREYQALEAQLKRLRAAETTPAVVVPNSPPDHQKLELERADSNLLGQLATELERRQREREFSERQRRVEMHTLEDSLVQDGIIPPYTGPVVVRAMSPTAQPFRGPALPSMSAKGATDDDIEQLQRQAPLSRTASGRSLQASGSTSPAATINSARPTVYREPPPVRDLPPMHYNEPAALPRAVTEGRDLNSRLDQMQQDEIEARKRGVLSVEDFEQIKTQMATRQLERDERLRSLTAEEVAELQHSCAVKIASLIRGFLARRRCKRLDAIRQLQRKQLRNAVHIQRVIRGFLGRRKYRRLRLIYLNNMKGYHSATLIQKRFRGFLARRYFMHLYRRHCAVRLQRVFRGFLGRQAVARERQRLRMLYRKQDAAARIQSVWRMKVAKEEYRSLRIHILAVIEIQRSFRGYLGRKKMARRRLWENTKPGPERIKLGLQFIEESKQAFERQQEEIDALHRAQERAESRISHIHAELKDSEKELVVLERELQEIDQIERDLQVLTHERNVLAQGIEDAAGMPRTAGKGHQKDLLLGRESTHGTDPMMERRKRAEAYALEMTIQLKRAEREKKRQELEIEFAAVFSEVEKKKKALQRLELSLADMESTRERKDREFRRLQKNLMQLLLEQKHELDELREKGLELETATATTAAAAVATAQKAREHEKRSHAMFSQTEELMKFQFMSMSLSYFSSLNMLKSLRDMNADTTSAAIALSADASATAASVASAANLPNIKKLTMGTNDFVEAAIRKKKEELAVAEKAKQELTVVSSHPLPENVRTWTVTDVVRWLDSLALSQYAAAFQEGSVDGPFLLELREEDLVQILNIRHKLHVRKILISREKLKPLNQQEMQQYQFVAAEDKAKEVREEQGIPTLDTVFSQARNGRIKRVEESINLGFLIDTEDERGNTLLIVAAQNRNKKLVEMLLLRGANINHQNAAGNTALHYAIAMEPEGILAEYLIEHGADDTMENVEGLTPYDGIAV